MEDVPMTPRYFRHNKYVFILHNTDYLNTQDGIGFGGADAKEITREEVLSMTDILIIIGVDHSGDFVIDTRYDEGRSFFVRYKVKNSYPINDDDNAVYFIKGTFPISEVERLIQPPKDVTITHRITSTPNASHFNNTFMVWRDDAFVLGFETEAEYLQYTMSK